MSSSYRPICLSHDPGLVIDREIRRDAVDSFNSRDGLEGHGSCDIVIGRWSGGLVELACPGMQLPGPTGCTHRHSSIEWIEADWLRLLHAARPVVDSGLLARSTFRCWPPERLNRLREDLGLANEGGQSSPTDAAVALREVLRAFDKVTAIGDSTPVGYMMTAPVHPGDYQRWVAAARTPTA